MRAFLLLAGLLSPSTSGPVVDACVPFIELHSAAVVAREAGETEEWVVANYRVNLWASSTPNGRGSTVGRLLPGSRAALLEEGPQDYRVRSPFDQSVGWVNKVQVARTLFLDDQTFRPCTPPSEGRQTVLPL